MRNETLSLDDLIHLKELLLKLETMIEYEQADEPYYPKRPL